MAAGFPGFRIIITRLCFHEEVMEKAVVIMPACKIRTEDSNALMAAFVIP